MSERLPQTALVLPPPHPTSPGPPKTHLPAGPPPHLQPCAGASRSWPGRKPASSPLWFRLISPSLQIHHFHQLEGAPPWGSRLTSTLADANRSCGPPKLGRLLLNRVRRCPRRSAGGPLGPDEPSEGLWGRRGVPRGSVHQSCTHTGQLSDPSSLVESHRAKTGFRRKPVGTRNGLRGLDESRRIDRLSRISARLMHGPPGHATASPRALRGPVGTQRTPSGPPGAPSDPVQ